MIVATGPVDNIPTVVAAMEYAFIGGSMGVVVGEKITRAIERAIAAAAAGGDRLLLRRRAHDGRGALADADGQDLRRARAAASDAGCRSSAVLTDPTTGGVTASFAMLGDLNIAEPKAPDRLRRAARHRADHPPEAAGRLPAHRVPARARHGRHGRRSPRDENDDRQRAALHGDDRRTLAPAAAAAPS